MIRVTFRVFGKEGHRQRASFGNSFKFTTFRGNAFIECVCEDRTHTNSFVELIITADSFKNCVNELNAQLSDGILESCSVGNIIIRDIEKKYGDNFKSIKNVIDTVIETICNN